MSDLLPALQALDRLNSWVRSDSYRCDYPFAGPRKHVYEMKRQALIRAHEAGLCERHTPIRVEATCNRCHGTGIYYDGWGGESRCRACTRGKTTLRFWASAIAGLGVWHTPSDRMPYAISQHLRPKPTRYPYGMLYPYVREDFEIPADVSEVWYPETEWEPNQPGKPLTRPEICAALNVAEVAFPERRAPHHQWGHHGDWIEDPHHFFLYLGRIHPLLCPFCGSAELWENVSMRVYHGPVVWSTLACQPCHMTRHTRSDDPTETPPELLTGDSEIRHWIDRNCPIWEERKRAHAKLHGRNL